MTARSTVEWRVREAAIAITSQCRPPKGKSPDAQTSLCELQSILEAVKNGHPRVKGLEHGVRYVADPILRDFFIAPHRLLEACEAGACGEDCDSQAALIAGLAGAIGFEVGLCAWGKPDKAYFQHVFALAMFPKAGQGKQRAIALDSTVPDSFVGWEPPPGRMVAAWIHRHDLVNVTKGE